MMITPSTYREGLKTKSYLDLMKERDRLVAFMHQFEAEETKGDRSSLAWRCHPSPDVQYQVYFEYLSALCNVMQERYNQEYVWGGRTLKQDAVAAE